MVTSKSFFENDEFFKSRVMNDKLQSNHLYKKHVHHSSFACIYHNNL